MTDLGRTVEAVDSHTEGETTRMVTGGLGPIPGATMADKLAHLREHMDDVRCALVLEPRGHDAVVLAFMTEPVTENAHTGVVFANDAGYLDMCGHGTIGIATVLVRTGKVCACEPVTEVVLDTPAGQVTATVRVAGGRPRSVAFQNVPSFVHATDVQVPVPGLGDLTLDIAWGGNWFAFVPWQQVGIPVEQGRLDDLMVAAKTIRATLAKRGIVGVDPLSGADRHIGHVRIFADESDDAGPATRALTLCPGRAYDRSPCGTGTSAKLAVLAHRETLADGQTLRSRSILGTEFRARVLGHTTVGDRAAVIPEIEGSAYVTGFAEFVLDPDDPFVHGLG